MILSDLPQDILIQIFIHLGLVDISSIARTNRYFQSVSNAPYLWKRLCEKILDADEINECRKKRTNQHFDWKELLHSSDKWSFCNNPTALRTDQELKSCWRSDNFGGILNCCIKATKPFTEYRRVFEVTIISAGWISIGFSDDHFMTNRGCVVGEEKNSLNVGYYIDGHHSELTYSRKSILKTTTPVKEGDRVAVLISQNESSFFVNGVLVGAIPFTEDLFAQKIRPTISLGFNCRVDITQDFSSTILKQSKKRSLS